MASWGTLRDRYQAGALASAKVPAAAATPTTTPASSLSPEQYLAQYRIKARIGFEVGC